MKPIPPVVPMAAWCALSMRYAVMLTEAQMIMTRRMLGLWGVVPMPTGEAARMYSEKTKAYSLAATAMGQAMVSGASAERIASAALTPIAQRTRANAKRLSRPVAPKPPRKKR